jgi:hypothetical protein
LQNENVVEPVAPPQVTTFEQAIAETNAVPMVQNHFIDATFVSNRSAQILNLLKPHDGVSDGSIVTKSGVEYRLRTPTPITTVTVRTAEPNAKLRMEVTDIEGNTVKTVLGPSAADPLILTGATWAIASSIKICCDSLVPLKKYEVKEIRVGVLTTEDISDALSFSQRQNQIRDAVGAFAKQEFEKIKSRETEIVSLKTTTEAHKKSIEDSLKLREEQSANLLKAEGDKIKSQIAEKEKQTAEIQLLQNQISTLQASRKSEDESLQATEKKNLDLQVEIKSAQDLIGQKTEEKLKLENELQGLRHDVQEWMGKKHLFTADLDGILKEYNFQSNIFLGLSLLPLAGSGYLAWRLYDGAASMLNTILTTTPPENIWAYLATRFPYATVAGFMIFVLMRYGFLPLIGKVFDLYGLRSRLQEKCFLVKKVTEGVTKTANLSDEQAGKLLVESQMEYIEKTLATKSEINPANVVIKELDKKSR